MKVKKVLLIISILCSAMIASAYYLYDIVGREEYISTYAIDIDEITHEAGEWVVRGTLDASGKAFIFKQGFSGIDYRKENGDFYLRLRYGVVSEEPAKNFEVYLKNELDDVNSVYLQGNSSEDVQLIWQK